MKREDILEIIEKENIRFIKLMFVDLFGSLKTVEIPISMLERALEGRIMIDGSCIKGFTAVHNADMALDLDLDSFRVLHFLATERWGVASFMCDIVDSAHKPMAGCTRSNLKRMLGLMRKAGFADMNIGFEPEFYLFKNKPNGQVLKSDFIDNGNYCAEENGDEGALVRREIMYELERIGIPCCTSHHENGPSQQELTYRFSNALESCDNLLLLKMIAKAVAKKHGYFATFMPKPLDGIAGNGLHTNVSLTMKNGSNAFWNKSKSKISATTTAFVSGVLTHARGLCFLTNPTINSYNRFVDNYEAPVNICWSFANRSAMVRIPHASGASARAEVRSVDASCNPYLAAAGILASGLDGIKGKLSISAVSRNIFELSDAEKQSMKLAALPSSLAESLEHFNKDEVLKKSLTPKIIEELIKHKQNELNNKYDISHFFDI